MDEDPPAELKFIITYLQRAKELDEKEPIISYYCRYYALKLAVEKGAKSKEAEGYLLSLMDKVEKDKLKLIDLEAVKNETIGYAHVENFALKIFLTADNEDRNGQATKKTARTFLAASIFLEVLKGFGDGEVDSDTIQKIKYAKFKVTDIMKALKEGRIPVAGPPGNIPDESASPSTITPSNAPAFPTTPTSIPPPDPTAPVFQPTASFVPPAAIIPSNATGDDDDEYDEEESYNDQERASIMQAGKHAKFAMSSLLYDDVKTAMENLEKALALLRPLKQI
ncbi:Vta1 like-domain-containing protein [Globomyces pollinis-pini]|nr:Vta1 like-domain-containing protein [Globomyces pollinis-pini]